MKKNSFQSKGGKARARYLTGQERRDIASKAARARWRKARIKPAPAPPPKAHPKRVWVTVPVKPITQADIDNAREEIKASWEVQTGAALPRTPPPPVPARHGKREIGVLLDEAAKTLALAADWLRSFPDDA